MTLEAVVEDFAMTRVSSVLKKGWWLLLVLEGRGASCCSVLCCYHLFFFHPTYTHLAARCDIR
jgi:hypothetical protein